MRLHPFELIQQEPGIQVRYSYDWHIGAMPERYTYDKTCLLYTSRISVNSSVSVIGAISSFQLEFSVFIIRDFTDNIKFISA